MSSKLITAIIRGSELGRVETQLKNLLVPGITVSKVKGYGEQADLYSNDWTVAHVRLEIVIDADRAPEVMNSILNAAHTGLAGDGIVFVQPLETVYRVRTHEKGMQAHR